MTQPSGQKHPIIQIQGSADRTERMEIIRKYLQSQRPAWDARKVTNEEVFDYATYTIAQQIVNDIKAQMNGAQVNEVPGSPETP